MIDKRLRNIHPKDLFFVLLYGLVLPYVFGIVAGFVDYYLSGMMPISIGAMLFWVIALYVGDAVRKQYEEPHLLYAIITGIGLVLSAVVIYTVPYVLTLAIMTETSRLLVFHPAFYLTYAAVLFNPVTWITAFSFSLLLWLVSIGIGTYLGVRKTTQRIF